MHSFSHERSRRTANRCSGVAAGGFSASEKAAEQETGRPRSILFRRLSGAMVAAAVAVLLVLGTGAAQPARAQVESVLYKFGATSTDGTFPTARLIMDSKGNLYGTTSQGGSSTACTSIVGVGCGTVFELVYDSSTNSYTEKVLYSFSGSDGYYPITSLTMDSSGNIYGSTRYGGSTFSSVNQGDGTVFELSPPATSGGNWTEKVLFSFSGTNGQWPSDLLMDPAGNLYGTTNSGGSANLGTAFELTQASGYKTENVLHNFTGYNSTTPASSDGQNPGAGLLMDSSGNLYGTTHAGGTANVGTVFELVLNSSTNSYTEKVLASFTGSDGAYPLAGLIMDSSGNLYGTTFSGGSAYVSGSNPGAGTVFELKKTASGYSSADTVLLSLPTDGADGKNPQGDLVMDSAGILYGTTSSGGSSSDGTVFELSPPATSGGSWTPKVLVNFNSTTGRGLYAGLTMDAAGNLFGTTELGGSSSDGTVFGIAPVKLSASSLSFGSVAFGSTSVAQTATITNAGSGKFSYSAASISGAAAADFAITSNTCSTVVAPNGTCSVSVAFTPSTTTAETATLDLSQAGMTQTISLTGTGVYPTASPSPSSLTFSSQDVGAGSSSQTVTLTNSSAVTLTVSSVGVTGDFAIGTNTCTSTVAPGGKCTVGVTFKPTAAGKRTGTLSFNDNASNSPQTVALSGTAEDFTLAARTTSETISPGGSATFDLQLSPQGGFNQAVSLACSGAPKGATCTVNPTSVTLDGTNNASFGVKVSTTGSAMLAPGPGNFLPPSGSLPLAAWLSLFGLLGLLALAKFSPRGGRIRRLAPLATLALLITFSVACGGGSSNLSTTNSNATPAGTYTLTVTGTSGSLTQSTQVTLKVQ